MAGPFEQIRKQAREVAAGKALESGRELDMSPGYGGEYTPSKYGTEAPASARPQAPAPQESAIQALPPSEPTSPPPHEFPPPPEVAPGIYGAPGDEWTYEVTADGASGVYRAKPPGGSWIDVSPANQPEVHAAITAQLADGTLKKVPTVEPSPEPPRGPAESAARAALQAHSRVP